MSHEDWCSICGAAQGFKHYHNEQTLPPKIEEHLPTSPAVDNAGFDNSLDSKSRSLRLQGIHLAVMKYFGG